jgi:hypothetical protein
VGFGFLMGCSDSPAESKRHNIKIHATTTAIADFTQVRKLLLVEYPSMQATAKLPDIAFRKGWGLRTTSA